MKNLIIRSIRQLVNLVFTKVIGFKNTEKIILGLARLANINLLMLSYQSIGILKYWDNAVSGERFVMRTVLKGYIQKENLIVFDVGANVGDYSKEIRGEFPDAIVYAFEPNPNTFEIMTKNLAHLKINCKNLGVSSSSVKQKIYTYLGDKTSQHASIYKNVLLDLHKKNRLVEMDSNNTTLDAFCSDNKIDVIDFLKIDTEGHELEVLKGAKTMIQENRIGIIQFEFNEMNIISRVFLKDFYDLLTNYNIYRLNSNNLIPLLKYESINEIFQFQNFLAINRNLYNLV